MWLLPNRKVEYNETLHGTEMLTMGDLMWVQLLDWTPRGKNTLTN